MSLISATLAISTWLIAAQSPVPSARELKQKALGSRDGLRSGHIILEMREPKVGNPSGKDYQQVVRKFDVYFDGKKRRSFVDWTHPNWKKSTRATITEFDYIFDWGPDYWVQVGSVRDLPLASTGQLFHPALLGMFCVDIGFLYNIERESKLPALYELGGKEEGTVTRDAIEGENTWRLEFKPRPKRTVRIWVAPRLGYQPVRVEAAEEGSGDKPFVTRVSSLYAQFPRNNVWFPKKVLYTSFLGPDIYDETIIEILEAEFNQPIDPALFGIEAFDLSPGRKLLGPGNRAMNWDGKRVVNSIHRAQTEELESSPASRLRPKDSAYSWWWLGAVMLSLVAITLFTFAFRQRLK